ncbi:MAG: hypothetical protein U5L72_11095 [Bacteroidales bacterium]|nr:hypothetical protein [Bacteroidales bacterium]
MTLKVIRNDDYLKGREPLSQAFAKSDEFLDHGIYGKSRIRI